MTTLMIQADEPSSVWSTSRARRHPAGGSSLAAAIRSMIAVVILVLALSGLVAMASLTSAGTVPPEGPTPGLGL